MFCVLEGEEFEDLGARLHVLNKVAEVVRVNLHGSAASLPAVAAADVLATFRVFHPKTTVCVTVRLLFPGDEHAVDVRGGLHLGNAHGARTAWQHDAAVSGGAIAADDEVAAAAASAKAIKASSE